MKHLLSLLDNCRTRDQHRFKQRIRALQQKSSPAQLEELALEIETSRAWVSERRSRVPVIEFPESLPVVGEKDRIKGVIMDHQVVVLAGETGSGKTTQLPKILLEMGYGCRGLIGHTQPRRLAARSVAARIADELGVAGGSLVGTKIRFQDSSSDQTSVKLMTDGILLAELQRDRYLSDYEVIIIDEAHERSLNIDFLLGVLHQLLARRSDLKLIITSATIETKKFSEHFHNAPVIEVSGRTYPVEVRYRPLTEDDEGADLHQGVISAVEELMHEGPGDILVFLSGEREIRDLADSLQDALRGHRESIDILPLYARLSNSEQNRVFQTSGRRRVVLATNVAETSLTVPGIRYVIDPGLVRISRYSYRTKVQRLPVEAISQASANQRQGRCGRVGPGICIRLYSEEDFQTRPEFTDPEILRTNLASVMLQMANLKLGDIRQFPFLQRPDERFVNDGLRLLEELGAVELVSHRSKQRRRGLTLSAIGRQLGRLPVDPRLGRMILAAHELHCVREVLIIVAAMSIQDPRERPHDKQQRADELHGRFSTEGSDFLSYLKLWDYIQTAQKEDSSSQFRKRCKKEFLHYLRVREWQDLYAQLRYAARELNLSLSEEPATDSSIHRALLTGLLSNIGVKDEKHQYQGARQTKFFVFPGSQLFKSQPKWLMAAELVETSKLYARCVAKIDSDWIEPIAAHLVRKSYHEPRYSKKRGAVVATEQVTLFGLLLVAGRTVQYGPINPADARALFIREAIVGNQLSRAPEFVSHNQLLINAVHELEAKSRRRDILVDEETLIGAYDRVLPESLFDDRTLQRWWKQQDEANRARLFFSRDDLMARDAQHVTEDDYPDVWHHAGLQLPIEYIFEPGRDDDGVNLDIPVSALNQIDEDDFAWQVPAYRHELVTAWIKSLPKRLRRNFVPAPDYATALLQAMKPHESSLQEAMAKQLRRMSGIEIPMDEWNRTLVPDHLKVNFRVRDMNDKIIAMGRDLETIRARIQGVVKETIVEATSDAVEQTGLTDWSFGELPSVIEKTQGRFAVKAYPALTDEGSTVAIRVYEDEREALLVQRIGLRKLVLLQVPSPVKYLQEKLTSHSKLAMYFNPWGRVDALIQDCIDAAIEELMQGTELHSEGEFKHFVTRVRGELNDKTLEVVARVERCLLLSYGINRELKGKVPLNLVQSYNDIKAHLSDLIFPGFVSYFGATRLSDVERYLKGLTLRLEKMPADPNKDRLRVLQVEKFYERWQAALKKLPAHRPVPEALQVFRWHLEEFRVSLFAQTLGTAFPVSEQRLKKYLDEQGA
ncbi:MAG: ATP-dependent RNA helicase HrpA [Idiomarina sp.]|nr:ATP-dependent RNA helicase HrpA [Idiomarina sp.]